MTSKNQRLKIIGKNIKVLRENNNLTQDNLAEKVNVTREHIAQVEIGAKTPSLTLIFNIADIFNVQVKSIIDF